jgi:thymidylate synthase
MNTTEIHSHHIGLAWLKLLGELEAKGDRVAPRGQGTRELLGVKLVVHDTRNNVFLSPERNLQYRFMVAEWLWIWFGLNDVKTISRYNPRIGEMASDDGITFAGAYGPRIKRQWRRVIDGLHVDPDSRQEVIQVYEPPPERTKDVPCTLSIQFFIRGGFLETVVNMRSSDVWLGLPYDFFNFSMLANIAAAELQCHVGSLTMHLGSSHLYDRNRDKALQVLAAEMPTFWCSPTLASEPPWWLLQVLQDDEKAQPPAEFEVMTEPWMHYGMVLNAQDNVEAFKHLTEAMHSWLV